MPSPDRHFANAAIFTHSASGITPNSGDAALYIKSDNKAYIKDSAGTEAPVASIGGSTGATDNLVLRADGTGGATVQNSAIQIDDATTSTQNNVAIINADSQTNSALVLTPKGTGALIAGPKPDGTATGGNARGVRSNDFQRSRSAATQVASGQDSVICGGFNNTVSVNESFIGAGQGNSVNGGQSAAVVSGRSNVASGIFSFIGAGDSNAASGSRAVICGGSEIFNGSSASGNYSAICGGYQHTVSGNDTGILSGRNGLADRLGMQSHASGRFAAIGDAQRARFVLRNKTTTNAAVELFLDGSSTRLTIPSGKSVGGTIQICGTTSGGETANLYIRQFLIRNRGGTTALIGGIQTVGTDIEGIAAADVTLSADDTNDALKVEVTGYTPVTGCTAAASTDVISKNAHGFSNNDDIVFTSLTGGAGLTANTVTYWVINANADDFQVSATRGGAAVNITTDYTDMTATRVIRWVANVDCTEIGHGT